MTDTPPPIPSQTDLLADLDRLSQGRGLTYGERTHLRGDLDLPFIDAQVEALEARRLWLPAALGALFAVAVVLLFFAGGATADSATWWPARPRGVMPFVAIFAATTPLRMYRTLSEKLGIYRAFRAMAAPTPITSSLL